METTNYKPMVLIQSIIQEDTAYGVTVERQAVLKEYFDIVTLSDIDKHPEYLDQIQAIGYVEPSQVKTKFLHLMPKLTNLKIISVNGVGYDSYYSHFEPFGIPMAYTPNAVTSGTADFAMSLILATATDLLLGVQVAMRERPPRSISRSHIVHGVNGRTLGIIGMGRIGYATARRARAFDMNILYHNRRRRTREEENVVGARYCPTLEEMLPQCDYVLLTCPRTPDTNTFFNKDKLELMKETAALINMARGELIDQDALVEALSSGAIRQAALDVTYPEPLPAEHPLLKLTNVIITPHIGGMTEPNQSNVFEDAVRNLKAALIDHKPIPFPIKHA